MCHILSWVVKCLQLARVGKCWVLCVLLVQKHRDVHKDHYVGMVVVVAW